MNLQKINNLSITSIFLTFAGIGLRGFGGVMPYVHAELVENKKWMTTEEFTELIVIGQILPGANVTNFAAMFGYRRRGWSGVLAAVLGILVPPFLLLIAIYYFFKFYSDLEFIKGALKGMLAVASVLVFVTAFKMIKVQKNQTVTLFFSSLCILLVIIFKWPLIYIILFLFPLSALSAWRKDIK